MPHRLAALAMVLLLVPAGCAEQSDPGNRDLLLAVDALELDTMDRIDAGHLRGPDSRVRPVRRQLQRILGRAAERARFPAHLDGLAFTSWSEGLGVMVPRIIDYDEVDLAAGIDLDLMYLNHPASGLPPGFYLVHVSADVTVPEARVSYEIRNLDGSAVQAGLGTILTFPDPVSELACKDIWPSPLGCECHTTSGPGVDENGEECTNYVRVCSWTDPGLGPASSVISFCLKQG